MPKMKNHWIYTKRKDKPSKQNTSNRFIHFSPRKELCKSKLKYLAHFSESLVERFSDSPFCPFIFPSGKNMLQLRLVCKSATSPTPHKWQASRILKPRLAKVLYSNLHLLQMKKSELKEMSGVDRKSWEQTLITLLFSGSTTIPLHHAVS